MFGYGILFMVGIIAGLLSRFLWYELGDCRNDGLVLFAILCEFISYLGIIISLGKCFEVI